MIFFHVRYRFHSDSVRGPRSRSRRALMRSGMKPLLVTVAPDGVTLVPVSEHAVPRKALVANESQKRAAEVLWKIGFIGFKGISDT